MRIIHVADLHLGATLKTNLSEKLRKKRKAEILSNFDRLANAAEVGGVSAILIAGDLFNASNISVDVGKSVAAVIKKYPEIDFYYLAGNHDVSGFLNIIDVIPDNLKLFDSDWKSYCLNPDSAGNIKLYGINFENSNSIIYEDLIPDVKDINLVMMHGQSGRNNTSDSPEIINLSKLTGRGIDYLALGHIHSHSGFVDLDIRGIYCYPGCLEGTGYDECGEHGYVLIDIEEETGCIDYKFVPFAKRHLYDVKVDVTGIDNTQDMITKIENEIATKTITSEDYLRITLTGTVDVDAFISKPLIENRFSEDYYSFMVKDSTGIYVDIDSYKNDISLKGEFVRTLLADNTLSEDEKNKLLAMGFRAFTGGNLDED